MFPIDNYLVWIMCGLQSDYVQLTLFYDNNTFGWFIVLTEHQKITETLDSVQLIPFVIRIRVKD